MTRSPLETLAALDYNDEASYRADIARIREQHAENFLFIRDEEGGHEAHEYLKANVAPDDRAEVLRDAMLKTRLADQIARTEAERLSAKAEELGCSKAIASYITALEDRVATLEEKVSELRYDVRKVRRAA